MPAVLIVEDDANIAQLLKFHFTKQGWSVRCVVTVEDADRSINDRRPDAIVLDLMLPKTDGLTYLKQLKRSPETEAIPVLILTAKGEEVDRVVGLELGADDYVVKPFSPRELVLRTQNILNRRTPSPSAAAAVCPPKMTCGGIEVNTTAHRVRVDGREVHLTLMEFRLLVTLMRHPDHVFTRDRLLDKVWDIHADVTTRTIDTHIKRLRQKLGSCASCIETVRGVGYRFVVP